MKNIRKKSDYTYSDDLVNNLEINGELSEFEVAMSSYGKDLQRGKMNKPLCSALKHTVLKCIMFVQNKH